MKHMKQKITAMLMAGMMTLAAVPAVSAGITVQAMDETMPAAFESEPNRAYSRPCKPRFDNIPAPLLALVPEEEFTNWKNFNEVLRVETPETLVEYTNIYSFIMTFGLTEDVVRPVMEQAIDEEESSLTYDELDLILSASEQDILNYFMTDYPIVIGNRFYTPQWLYEHTTEEYAAAGITPEMIAGKLERYPDLPFTKEAAIAFSEKLYSYVGSSAALVNWGFKQGDFDLNGELSVLDIIALQRYLLGLENISFVSWAAADMNSDNTVDIMDLALVKREILKLYPPVVQPTEPPTEPPTDPTEPATEQPTEPDDRPIEVTLNVMEYNQHPDYPTGCESVALYMLLKYYGTDVTVDQIVNKLPKGPIPYTKNGKLYGPDPNRFFVGDPRNSSSYGVFNEPIAQVAEQFRPGVQCKTGAPLEDVIEILDSGNPAQVWYTTNPTRGIVYRREWYIEDTGELFKWPGGEHAVVVCGHDQTNLTYRDPNTGGTVVMEIEEFRKIYDELGGRIVYYNE